MSSTEVSRAQHRLQRDATWVRKHRQEMPEKLGVALITGRTLTDVEQWPAHIAAVTPEQVQDAAWAILRAECAVTGMLLPTAVGNTTGAAGR